MLRQPEVVLRVTLVPDEPEEVKPREEGGREHDVGLRRLLDVVPTKGRVSRSQDGDPGIERGHNTSLGGGREESQITEGKHKGGGNFFDINYYYA